jgi:hypothetical protein
MRFLRFLPLGSASLSLSLLTGTFGTSACSPTSDPRAGSSDAAVADVSTTVPDAAPADSPDSGTDANPGADSDATDDAGVTDAADAAPNDCAVVLGSTPLAPDPSYVASLSFSAAPNAVQISLDVNGNLLVLANGGANYVGSAYLRRLLPSGQPDIDFGTGGSVALPPEYVYDRLTTDAHGRILLTGATATGAFVRRFTARGLVDATFGSAGGRVTFGLGEASSPRAIAVDGDTFLATVNVGQDSDNQTVSIRSDGTIQATLSNPVAAESLAESGGTIYFGFPGGVSAYTFAGAAASTLGGGNVNIGEANGSSQQGADIGQIVVAPDGSLFLLDALEGIVHVLADGSFDPTFGTSGRADLGGGLLALTPRCDGAFEALGIDDSTTFIFYTVDAKGKPGRTAAGSAGNLFSASASFAIEPATGRVYMASPSAPTGTQVTIARFLP